MLCSGIYLDRIQTVVQSRNNEVFDEIAETALEEESSIISKFERYRGEGNPLTKCTHCGKKTGHSSNKCFSKTKDDDRINHFSVKRQPQQKGFTSFNCGEKGHIARNWGGGGGVKKNSRAMKVIMADTC
jgi:hypothetical protein